MQHGVFVMTHTHNEPVILWFGWRWALAAVMYDAQGWSFTAKQFGYRLSDLRHMTRNV